MSDGTAPKVRFETKIHVRFRVDTEHGPFAGELVFEPAEFLEFVDISQVEALARAEAMKATNVTIGARG